MWPSFSMQICVPRDKFSFNYVYVAVPMQLCRRLGIKDNEKRWMDALSNNLDAKRDRAVLCALLIPQLCLLVLMIFGRFLRTRLRSRRALANQQRKILGVENPVILLETDAAEVASQQESPRSASAAMEMEQSTRLDSSLEDASPTSPDETESNIEYEFETC
jgi:hypothetical protein